jgi:hypothetical protein
LSLAFARAGLGFEGERIRAEATVFVVDLMKMRNAASKTAGVLIMIDLIPCVDGV